jgi:mono/diheme cytochrome c family protein
VMAMKEGQRIIEIVVEKKRRTFRMRRAVIVGLLLAGSATSAPAADPAAGQKIFKAQCGICHSVAAGVNGIGCQVPSWNENMNCFSDLAINSENISRRYSHY